MNKLMLVKSIVYRVYGFLVAFLVALIFTGSIGTSLSIGLIESFIKILTYYWFDIVWKKFTRDKYKPCVIWLTGLSGAGKSTIANDLLLKLRKKDLPVILLDADDIRSVMKNTGFDEASRKQHNRNVGYIAHLFEKQGSIVIASIISPFEDARQECRRMCDNFIEVYVSTPIEECANRDPKGLYKKAYAGEIKDFTGISSPYEIPTNPEININTKDKSIDECSNQIIDYIVNGKQDKLKIGTIIP